MSDRPSRTLLAVLLACGTIGVSTQQRPAPAADATSRAVAAAEAFLATLDQGQRAKANIDLNEKTRTIWSNLPVGTTMQVGQISTSRSTGISGFSNCFSSCVW